MKSEKHHSSLGPCCLILSALALFIGGCWDSGLPAEVSVPFSDGSSVVAPADGGASVLANTSWSVYGDPTNPYLLFRMEFNDQGDVIRIYDNNVYADVIGQEMIPDGSSQASLWQGGTYAAECYVANQDANVGFIALINARFGPLVFGTGTFTFSGTLLGDRIEGLLDLAVEVDPAFVSLLPFTPGSYQQQVIAVPVGSEPPQVVEQSSGAQTARADAVVIEREIPAAGSLTPVGDEDLFTFTLDRPLPLVIETSGSQGDTVLWLYDVNMAQIGFDDDSGEGLLSRIETSDLPAGVYYVRVQGFQGQVVDPYALTVSWRFYY